MLALAMMLSLFTKGMVVLLFSKIEQGIDTSDSSTLILSIFFYVLHQLVICSFIYIGALLLSFSFVKKQLSFMAQGLFACLVMAAIFVENAIHMEHYSYITHLVILIFTLIFFNSNHVSNHKCRLFPLVCVLILIILSMEWLNLIPSLSPFGFGRDDLAISIKTVGDYRLLNAIVLLFFILCSVLTLLFAVILSIFNKQIHALNNYQEQEQELQNARIVALESRVFKEVRTLAHDLKTPLVSIEGLTSLMEMIFPKHEKMKTYSSRIQGSVQKMKEMISEILREDVREKLQVKELFDYVTAHAVLFHPRIHLSVEVAPELPEICVNKIRMARAVTNLIENAMDSIGDRSGRVLLQATQGERYVWVIVSDDGPGIEPEIIEGIWEEGYSTQHSTGLGLSFVQAVVAQHDGQVTMDSDDHFTKVTIKLPLYGKEVEDDKDSHH